MKGICVHCEERRKLKECACCGELACRQCRSEPESALEDEADDRTMRDFFGVE